MPRTQRSQAEVDRLMGIPHKAGATDKARVKASMPKPAKKKAAKKASKKDRPNPHKYRKALGSGLAGKAMDMLANRRKQEEDMLK